MSKAADRLAFILPDLRNGGAERVSLLIANEMSARGYLVDLVLRNKVGQLLKDVSPDIDVVDLAADRYRGMVLPLYKYLAHRRPAAVVAAMWPLTGLVAGVACIARPGGRLVLVEHTNLSRSASVFGVSDFVNRRLGRLIYGTADKVVCVSEGVSADLIRRTGMSSEAVSVVYNPVKPHLHADGVNDTELSQWWCVAQKKIIAVGSLKPAKDYETLIRGLSQLLDKVDSRGQQGSVRLIILGEGQERSTLESLIVKMGLDKVIRLAGAVDDPYTYLAKADLFVMSSAWEGLPGALIEALVAGVPVVSTDCPSGPAEILENGRYGRLVPVGDPEALAVAMAEALDAPHDRDMLRRRGGDFTVERAADQYLALLDPGGKLLTPA